MNEIKRILRNKKFVIFLVSMILLNTGFFIKTQYDTLSENDITESMSDVAENYMNAIKLVRKLEPSNALEEITDRIDTYDGEWNSDLYNIQVLKQKLEYIVSYSSFLDNIKQNQETYSSTSIFSDENDFSYKNIEKTVDDFSEMSDDQVSIGNYLGVESFFEFSFTDYAIIIILLGVCIQLLGSRKQSYEVLLHSCYNGRGRLAVKRVGLLFGTSVFFVIILYINNLLAALYLYGGVDDLGEAIQSIEPFMRVSYSIDIFHFIGFYLSLKCLGVFCISLLIYFLLIVVNDATAGFVGLGAITIIEYVLYTSIDIQSNFVLLKYINIFAVINESDIIGIYLNINIFGEPVHVQLALLGFVLLATIIMIPSIVIISAKKYPCGTSSKVTRLIRCLENACLYITTKLHLFGFEILKQLFFQGGLLIACALAVVAYESRVDQNYKYYDPINTYLNQFYDDNSQKSTQEAQQYISEKNQELSQIHSEQQSLESEYKSGKITYSEYYNRQSAYDTLDAKESAIEVFTERVNTLVTYEEQTGVTCSIVNPNGYNKLFGEDSFGTHQEFACKAILFEVLFLYMLFVYEKQTKASFLVRTTVRGRGVFIRRKLLQVVLVSAVVVSVLTYMEIYNVKIVYGLPSLDAAIGSIECMQFMEQDISIQMFLGMICVLRFLVLTCIGLVILMISVLTQKREQTLLAGILALLIPAVLFVVGIKGCKYFSFILPLSVIELIYNNDIFSAKIIMIYLSCAILGGISYFITKRKWE